MINVPTIKKQSENKKSGTTQYCYKYVVRKVYKACIGVSKCTTHPCTNGNTTSQYLTSSFMTSAIPSPHTDLCTTVAVSCACKPGAVTPKPTFYCWVTGANPPATPCHTVGTTRNCTPF